MLCQKKRRSDVLSGCARGGDGINAAPRRCSCTESECVLSGAECLGKVLPSKNKTKTNRETRIRAKSHDTLYQHCKLVEALAEELGITLLFLPSYSPNLNLIERLWKFVKKKCLNNVYYETFDDFKKGINDCLSRVENEYKTELDTLMTPKFQNLKKGQLLAL